MLFRSSIFACVLLAVSNLQAQPPATFTRSLGGLGFPLGGRQPLNTFSDYNGDGIQDLAIGQTGFSRAQVTILDGLTGNSIRSFIGPDDADSNFNGSLSVTPDLNSDGLNDFLVGDPLLNPNRRGSVFSFFSSGSTGLIRSGNTLNYELTGPGPGGGFGNDTAVLGQSAAIAWSDAGRVQLVDVETGASVAKISSGGGGFGFSVFNIGDIDQDGVDDLITSDPNAGATGFGRGEAYVISGAVTTEGEEFVPIDALPDGALLATLTNEQTNGGLLGSSRSAQFANLGDPTPNNGVRDQLIVTGTLDGFTAHVLSIGDVLDDSVVGQVAAVNSITSDLIRVGNIRNLDDINQDGIDEFALLETFNDRVLIINGAGLLDGFDASEDVIQTILPDDPSDRFVSLESLGDYDANGRFDFLIGVLEQGSAADVRYDIYSTTSVPEPTSYLLVWATLLSVASVRRRNNS